MSLKQEVENQQFSQKVFTLLHLIVPPWPKGGDTSWPTYFAGHVLNMHFSETLSVFSCEVVHNRSFHIALICPFSYLAMRGISQNGFVHFCLLSSSTPAGLFMTRVWLCCWLRCVWAVNLQTWTVAWDVHFGCFFSHSWVFPPFTLAFGPETGT